MTDILRRGTSSFPSRSPRFGFLEAEAGAAGAARVLNSCWPRLCRIQPSETVAATKVRMNAPIAATTELRRRNFFGTWPLLHASETVAVAELNKNARIGAVTDCRSRPIIRNCLSRSTLLAKNVSQGCRRCR